MLTRYAFGLGDFSVDHSKILSASQ